MNITLANVQYHPNSDAVALYLEPPAPMGPILRPTTQAALQARAAAGVPWSDAEALAEAQAIVDAEFASWGFTVVLPEAS